MYQSSLWLFLLLSALVLIELVSSGSSKDDTFYVTPTQPPNPECPQNISCQTLQYYFDNSKSLRNSHSKVTLIFLKGNHSVAPCFCTRFIHLEIYLSIVGLNRNVVIHNMEVVFSVPGLRVDNIVFHNGAIRAPKSVIFLSLYSVKLIENYLYVHVASGDLVRL